jgi:regulator of replication initiation timing
MARSKTTTAPILENEHVKELLAIMEANNVPTMKDLLAVLNQVGAMERQLDAAVKELAAIRRELNEAREQAHPVKAALQHVAETLEKNVTVLRERLDMVKKTVIEGCKNAVADFREKGISALDNVIRFFKIKPILESMRDDLSKSIRFSEATISNIEYVSTEYHEAGLHIKNMVRAMAGKEAIQEAKSVGKLAKALEAPFKAEHSCLVSMKKTVEATIGNLTRLEERAVERKPSIQKTMQSLNEQIAQEKKDAPTAERPRPSHAER